MCCEHSPEQAYEASNPIHIGHAGRDVVFLPICGAIKPLLGLYDDQNQSSSSLTQNVAFASPFIFYVFFGLLVVFWASFNVRSSISVFYASSKPKTFSVQVSSAFYEGCFHFE